MKTAIIEVEDDGDEGLPRNESNFTYPKIDLVKEWLYQLENWGIERLILAGDDVLVHPRWWDLCDYIERHHLGEVYAMTNGMFLRREDIREFSTRDITPVVPLDLVDPVTGRVYGYKDYSPETQGVIQKLRECEIWQGITPENTQEAAQMMQMAVQLGKAWEGHVDKEKPPNEVIQRARTNDFDIVTIEQWYFVHHNAHIPEIPYYESKILRGRASYTGTLHVSSTGHLSSVHKHGDSHICSYDRSDLEDFALDKEIVS